MTVKNVPGVYRRIFQSDNTTGILYIKNILLEITFAEIANILFIFDG